MNVAFLTGVKIDSLKQRGIYQDLLRKFTEEGHKVTIITPSERREGEKTEMVDFGDYRILKVRTLNLQKANLIEKGLATVAVEYQFVNAIKKYLTDQRFDLVLYTTPPITFVKAIKYLKKRDQALTYLLLKDIFPQNAVDMKMFSEKSFIYRFFRNKEKELYQISDAIGCMSKANVEYILKHNPEINAEKVENNPNSITPHQFEFNQDKIAELKEKYSIPEGKTVFAYGGNLGRPQGIDFLLETIIKSENLNVFFLIIGIGTEFNRMENWFRKHKPTNAALLKNLPKDDFDEILQACDVGLIFLDKKFTIPNFPSRLLSYLEMKLPVIAATDSNSDVGDVVENAGCGVKVIAGDIDTMIKTVEKYSDKVFLQTMKERCWKLLKDEYTVDYSYEIISNRLKHR